MSDVSGIFCWRMPQFACFGLFGALGPVDRRRGILRRLIFDIPGSQGARLNGSQTKWESWPVTLVVVYQRSGEEK